MKPHYQNNNVTIYRGDALEVLRALPLATYNKKEDYRIHNNHNTSAKLVQDLIELTPIDRNDSVLDAGSGKNKVWYNNVPATEKYECEIENGCDFLTWTQSVDWVIGNPPYHISWKFLKKASEIARKGIGYLVSNKTLNSLFTTRRQEIIRNSGFHLQRFHIITESRWYGRYYYLIYTKDKNDFLSWERNTYKEVS